MTFRTCFFSPISRLNDEKSKLQVLQKASRHNGNVQSHDQEESKLKNTINANSGADTPTYDKIKKNEQWTGVTNQQAEMINST